MAVEGSYPEITRKYNAAKGEMAPEELKQILLNEEIREVELKERNTEGQVLQAEPAVPEQKTSFRGQCTRGCSTRGHHTCRRCGNVNHESKECWSSYRICYNCKQLTNNHTAETCLHPTVYGRNRVVYRYNRRVATHRGRHSLRARKPRNWSGTAEVAMVHSSDE